MAAPSVLFARMHDPLRTPRLATLASDGYPPFAERSTTDAWRAYSPRSARSRPHRAERRQRVHDRAEVGVCSRAERPAYVVVQRRRVRAGHVQGSSVARARSAPAPRRRAALRVRGRCRVRDRLRARRVRARVRPRACRARRCSTSRRGRRAHLRLRVLVRRHRAPRRRRVRRRRRERAALQPRRRARDAARPAAVPRGARALRAADDREQRRNTVDGAVDRAERRRRVCRARRRAVHRHAGLLRFGSRPSSGELRDRAAPHDVPRSHLRSRARRRRRSAIARSPPSSRAPRSRGSDPSTSISVSTSTTSRPPARRSRRGWWCSTTPCVRSVWPPGWCASSPKSRAASARRAARARHGSRRSCPGSCTDTDGSKTSRSSRTSAAHGTRNHDLRARPVGRRPDQLDAHALPRSLPRAHPRRRLPVGDAGARRVASPPWRASRHARRSRSRSTARSATSRTRRSRRRRRREVTARPQARASSCRSTTLGVSTGTSGSSTTACSGRGRCPRASRC